MSLDANDPRLTDYVLGELSADDRAEIEAALADSPELDRAVEEIRATCEMLSRSLKGEPALALTDSQRTAIQEQSTDPESTTVSLPKTPARRSTSKLFVLVASLLVAVTVGALMKFGDGGLSLTFNEAADSIGDDDESIAPPDSAFSRPTVPPYLSLSREDGGFLENTEGSRHLPPSEDGRLNDRNEDGGFRFNPNVAKRYGRITGGRDGGTTIFSGERVSTRSSPQSSRFGSDIPQTGGFRWSDSDGDRAYDGGTDSSQASLAFDVIILGDGQGQGGGGEGGGGRGHQEGRRVYPVADQVLPIPPGT